MVKKIHFIGIGGISMSGLAEIMHDRGVTVSGSDMKTSHVTDHLETLGIKVSISHSAANITDDLDLVIYTAAIAKDNEELLAAREKVSRVLTRSQFLGELMSSYEFPICISGTHGKTTTTSMLSEGLIGANFNPTITVGGILSSIGGNIRLGDSKYFITEACEYCNSFLDFFPKIGIILNIEEDHLDFFKDIDDIRHSFARFANLIPTDGFLALNGNISNRAELLKDTTCKVETFGLTEDFDWYAKNIVCDNKACADFDVFYKGTLMGHIKLSAPGEHNILNCLSVCSVCHFLAVDTKTLNNGIAHFTGADQRFEIKGDIHGVTIVDDYAHHPTEIAATLSVANAYPHNNLYVVFQPHTYTRTKAFLNDFAKVLSTAGHIIVTDIYAAREKNPGDIHAQDIVNAIHNLGHTALYMDDFEAIADYLLENCVPNDLVITMGAGNVNQIADILLGK